MIKAGRSLAREIKHFICGCRRAHDLQASGQQRLLDLQRDEEIVLSDQDPTRSSFLSKFVAIAAGDSGFSILPEECSIGIDDADLQVLHVLSSPDRSWFCGHRCCSRLLIGADRKLPRN